MMFSNEELVLGWHVPISPQRLRMPVTELTECEELDHDLQYNRDESHTGDYHTE
jgi:hypothetical protein